MIRIIESVTQAVEPIRTNGASLHFHKLGSGWIVTATCGDRMSAIETGQGPTPDDALADARARLLSLRDVIDALLDATADEATAGDLSRSA